MRILSTALEVAGMALLVFGLYLILPAIAYVVSGLSLIALAVLMELGRANDQKQQARGRGAPR